MFLDQEETMTYKTKGIKPTGDMIKLKDEGGNIFEIPLTMLPPCVLERWIYRTQVPGNIVLDGSAESLKMIRSLSRCGMIFKIVK
jgi:hypothetical protein